MTAVVVVFKYQGSLGIAQGQKLGASYTHLGIRKIAVNEKEQTIAVEYDATRMDANGVAALMRQLGVPVAEATVAS